MTRQCVEARTRSRPLPARLERGESGTRYTPGTWSWNVNLIRAHQTSIRSGQVRAGVRQCRLPSSETAGRDIFAINLTRAFA